MVALGSECPVSYGFNGKKRGSKEQRTCLLNKYIGIYKPKELQHGITDGCSYNENKGITGVLCCRTHRRAAHRRDNWSQEKSSGWGRDIEDTPCYPACRNGGTCLPDGSDCLCPEGFFGHSCQHGGCKPRCLNGGICYYGFCKCQPPFYGSFCQNSFNSGDSKHIIQRYKLLCLQFQFQCRIMQRFR